MSLIITLFYSRKLNLRARLIKEKKSRSLNSWLQLFISLQREQENSSRREDCCKFSRENECFKNSFSLSKLKILTCNIVYNKTLINGVTVVASYYKHTRFTSVLRLKNPFNYISYLISLVFQRQTPTVSEICQFVNKQSIDKFSRQS